MVYRDEFPAPKHVVECASCTHTKAGALLISHAPRLIFQSPELLLIGCQNFLQGRRSGLSDKVPAYKCEALSTSLSIPQKLKTKNLHLHSN
jgi:hypothetical protein